MSDASLFFCAILAAGACGLMLGWVARDCCNWRRP
jgi:hypothetical protein